MFTALKNGKLKYGFKITPTLRKYCIDMNSQGSACYVTHKCPKCEPPEFIHLKLEARGKVKPVSMSVCDKHPWSKPKGKEKKHET